MSRRRTMLGEAAIKDIKLPSLERWPALQVPARRLRYSLGQLLERRLWLFVIADAFFVLSGLLGAAISGARLEEVYRQGVLFPCVVLGIPALAGVVAIERRSGSLDLALAVPSTERYFLRRMLPVNLLLLAQSLLILTFALAENAGGWHLIPGRLDVLADYGRAVYQAVELQLFLIASALFWAVRLRSVGGVAVASIFTAALLWRWLSASPELASQFGVTERFFGVPQPVVDWIGRSLAVGLASLILFLYARERVRRPETMLN